MPDLSVVIVNWNTRTLLAECLASVLQHADGLDLEVIVVDNASSDGSQAMVRVQFPRVRLIANQENAGFAKANNQGVALCQARYALLLNSDARVTPGALRALVNLAESQVRAAIIGAQLLNPDGSFQASHTRFPNLWREFLILTGLGRKGYGRWYPSHGPDEDRGPRPVDYVEGACLLIRREAYQAVEGLDEGYFMYAEDVDLCYTLREHGWEVWYQPGAKVIHLGGGSSRNRRSQREADLYRSRVRFFRKHYGDVSAVGLKVLIYSLTAIKFLVHGMLQLFTHGRRGRTVVGIGDLITALRDV